MPEKVLENCPRSPHHHLEVASRKHRNGKQHFFILCKNCHMRGPRKKTPQEAVDTWNDLPRALQWTKEPPTTPGGYWWREKQEKRPRIVDVGQAAGMYLAFTPKGLCKVNELDGEWAGPLPEPREK